MQNAGFQKNYPRKYQLLIRQNETYKHTGQNNCDWHCHGFSCYPFSMNKHGAVESCDGTVYDNFNKFLTVVAKLRKDRFKV